MTNIKPSGTITLYSGVDISSSARRQIVFKNITEQKTYFAKKKIKEYKNCSYVKDSVKIPITPTDLAIIDTANYISFVNSGYNDRIFYGEISDVEYINNGTVLVKYNLDGLQSYMFDINSGACINLREQLNEDDWETSKTNTSLHIPELDTMEEYNPSDDEYAIPEEMDAIQNLTPGHYARYPSVGLSTFADEPQSVRDAFKPVLAMKLNWSLYPTTPVKNLELPSGKSIDVVNDVIVGSKLTLLNMFSGFFNTSWYFEKLNFNAYYASAVSEWIRDIEASGTTVDEAIAGYMAANSGLTRTEAIIEIATSDANIATNSLVLPEDMYDMNAISAPVRTPDKLDNQTMPGVIAWLELDDDGKLPEVFQMIIDGLNSRNMMSDIVWCMQIPKFMVDIKLKDDGWWSASYPDIVHGDNKYKFSCIKAPVPDGIHPKAYRYPGNRLTVVLPDGTSKNYSIEMFKERISFNIYGSITSIPCLNIIPYDYGYSPMTDSSVDYTDHLNISAAMKWDKLPSVGIASDAYLADIGAEMNNRLKMTEFEKMGEVASQIASVASAVVGAARLISGGLGQAAIGGATAVPQSVATLSGIAQNTAAETLSKNLISNWSRSDITNSIFNSRAAGNYSLTTNGASSDITSTIANDKIIFRYDILREDILNDYSQHLYRYGCKSNRFGVPRVIRYIRNQTINIPKMLPIEGSQTRLGTYLQTKDVYIEGCPPWAAQQIQDMFNGGCWFWEGDTL